MNEHLPFLKRVGLLFVASGILGVGYAAYANRQFASEEVYSLIAVGFGVLLMRGSLVATKWVTWSATAMAGLFGTLIASLPLTEPLELWLLKMHLSPLSAILPRFLALTAGTAVLFWILSQLLALPVIEAQRAGGMSASFPKYALAAGILLAAANVVFNLALKAESPTAVRLAQEQFGANYKYHVKAIRSSGDHFWAELSAYNDHEINPVQVEWSAPPGGKMHFALPKEGQNIPDASQVLTRMPGKQKIALGMLAMLWFGGTYALMYSHNRRLGEHGWRSLVTFTRPFFKDFNRQEWVIFAALLLACFGLAHVALSLG